ncbi:hypothetical protein IWQ56_004867 [Coemansia nantahalensis]|uniref:Uncharacterized protein n=1 Tax=Coemansia helicoidea TaxID=1286919 RepID=A0ACC1LF38_9FUNG|nr:hypothetical protein IWQ56_004867 [Coemansia nantahalensis]KAJ2807443.1 hypothetical protein H4R21_000477 [Coemansia helicoidea]
MSALVAHLRDMPAVTKLAAAAYTCLSAAAILLRYQAGWTAGNGGAADAARADPARHLVLRPGLVLSYPWTVATGALTEGNPVLLVCDVAVLLTVGCFLERQWGARNYAAFLAVAATAPALAATGAAWLLYAVRGRAELLYAVQIGGLAGVFSGFTVGLKQLVPEHSIKLLRGAVGFRVNDLPGLYTLVMPIVFGLLGDLGGILLVNIGFLVSFVYLRFYQRTGNVRGDRSDAFAFCTFFPEFAQPVVRRVSDAVFRAAVACRIVTSEDGYRQAVDLEAGLDRSLPTAPSPPPPAPQPEDSDAERRRALATKALDQRLGSASATPVEPATEAR